MPLTKYTLPKKDEQTEILFINVPTSYEQNVIPDDAAPSFGLLRMVVATRELYKKNAAILDAHNAKLSPEEITQEITLINPKIIGINPTSINIPEAKIISHFCEKNKIPFIIGGILATLDPASARKEFPAAFAVIRGSGEIAIRELLEAVDDPSKKSSDRGIYYLGDPIENRKDYARDINLDELPIVDQSLYVSKPVRKYSQNIDGRIVDLKEVSLYITRGCPFSCTFCSSPMMHPFLPEFGVEKYSRPRIEKVIEEIKLQIEKLGINSLHFVDDLAFATKKHLVEFCERLKEEKFSQKIFWRMMSRIDFLDNLPDEQLELAKKAGLWRLGIGIESGDQTILNMINKKIKVEQIEGVLSRLKEKGIDVKTFFMMGYPGETKEQLSSTQKMIIELTQKKLINELALFQLKPYPGTKLFQSLENDPETIKNLSYLRTTGGVKGKSETERIFGSTAWLPDNLKIGEMTSGEVRETIEKTYEKFHEITKGAEKQKEITKLKLR